jgi:hypothetical protein
MTMRVPDEGYSRMRRGIKLFILQSLHLLYKYTIRIMFCFIRLVYEQLVKPHPLRNYFFMFSFRQTSNKYLINQPLIINKCGLSRF